MGPSIDCFTVGISVWFLGFFVIFGRVIVVMLGYGSYWGEGTSNVALWLGEEGIISWVGVFWL